MICATIFVEKVIKNLKIKLIGLSSRTRTRANSLRLIQITEPRLSLAIGKNIQIKDYAEISEISNPCVLLIITNK